MSTKSEAEPVEQSPETDTVEQAEPVEQAETEQVEQAPNTETVEPVEQPETATIEFDDAVELGKKLVATIQTNKMRLGELADCVETDHGEKKLEKWAAEIGLSYESVKRYRSTYRKYKDANLGETSPSQGVLAALAAHPARDQIIKELPNLTVREARTLASDHRKTNGHDTSDEDDAAQEPAVNGHATTTDLFKANGHDKANENAAQGQVKPKEGYLIIETRGWFEDAMTAARRTFKYGHPAQERTDPYVLTKALVDPDPDEVERVLRKGAEALTTLADTIKDALADARANARSKPKLPMWDAAAPAELGAV